MVQSGDDYREKNRIRLQRFYDKQKRQGKKRVSALVSDEAYTLLVDVKEQTGASMSTLIDQAVTMAYGAQGIPDIDDTTLSEYYIASYGDPGQDDTGMEPGAIEDAVNAMGGPVESIGADDTAQGDQEKTDDELLRERDLKLVEIAEQYPGRNNAQKWVDVLNASGITLKGVAGEWTRKKFTDNLRFAKKRLGIK